MFGQQRDWNLMKGPDRRKTTYRQKDGEKPRNKEESEGKPKGKLKVIEKTLEVNTKDQNRPCN